MAAGPQTEKQGTPETPAEASGKVVRVTSVDELLAAIAPDTVIELAEGEYDLSTASDYGADTHSACYSWNGVWDEEGRNSAELVITADNLTLRGEGMDRTVLLECLSNLVANELFERHESSDAAADRIISDIARLKELVRDLVIVSNHYEIKEDFDEETMMYARILDAVNDRIGAIADKVIRIEP